MGSPSPAGRPVTRSPGPRAAPERSPAVEVSPPPPSPREDKAAAQSVRKAREFYRATPQKIDEAIALFEEAVWEARGTPLFDDVKKEFDAIQKKQADLLQAEL